MPKGRPTPKPVRAPKAAAPKATTRVAAPKPAPALKPKVTLRAPNVTARNPLIEKNINAVKKLRGK